MSFAVPGVGSHHLFFFLYLVLIFLLVRPQPYTSHSFLFYKRQLSKNNFLSWKTRNFLTHIWWLVFKPKNMTITGMIIDEIFNRTVFIFKFILKLFTFSIISDCWVMEAVFFLLFQMWHPAIWFKKPTSTAFSGKFSAFTEKLKKCSIT